MWVQFVLGNRAPYFYPAWGPYQPHETERMAARVLEVADDLEGHCAAFGIPVTHRRFFGVTLRHGDEVVLDQVPVETVLRYLTGGGA